MDRLELAIGTAWIAVENMPLAGRLAAVAAAGFRCVHWTDRNPSLLYSDSFAREVAAMLDGEGLRCFGVHAASRPGASLWSADALEREGGLEMARNRAAFCARLGARVLVVHPPGAAAAGTPGRFDDALDALVGAVRGEGAGVAMENAGFAAEAGLLERWLGMFPADRLGLCFDSGHAHIAGQEDFPERFAGRIECVHLHDNDGANDLHLLPFDGGIDWEAAMGRIAGSGYRGPLVLEVQTTGGDGDVFLREALARGRKLAKRQGGS
jgi:sugar phosphate isomerase/epimerase